MSEEARRCWAVADACSERIRQIGRLMKSDDGNREYFRGRLLVLAEQRDYYRTKASKG